MLGVRANIIRGLVAQGLLGVAAGYRNGFAKLVPEKEVQRFAEGYVSTSVLARRFRLNSGSLARHLNESGTPLLAIPNPDAGRGYAYFLRNDVAAQIRPPTQRKLREESQRRMRAARKRSGRSTGSPRKSLLVNPCDGFFAPAFSDHDHVIVTRPNCQYKGSEYVSFPSAISQPQPGTNAGCGCTPHKPRASPALPPGRPQPLRAPRPTPGQTGQWQSPRPTRRNSMRR